MEYKGERRGQGKWRGREMCCLRKGRDWEGRIGGSNVYGDRGRGRYDVIRVSGRGLRGERILGGGGKAGVIVKGADGALDRSEKGIIEVR